MKNWETLEADKDYILNKHFTPGRSGRTIDRVLLHHNAGVLSLEDIYNVWQVRPASAHYQVADTLVGQYVYDDSIAWHAGNFEVNCRSIAVEHKNSAGAAQGWPISAETLETGAHLVAAICKRYKLGRPLWLSNVFPHSDEQSTYCPGVIRDIYLSSYMKRAGEWYDAMTGAPAPKPTPAPAQPSRKTYSTNDMHWVVDSGDTLSKIARHYYGDAKYAQQIANYNGISLNSTLNVGDRIWVNGPIVWIIEAPDTIRTVAAYYGLDPSFLAAKNGLSGPDAEIYIGNILTIL
jgi:hypothetical protein